MKISGQLGCLMALAGGGWLLLSLHAGADAALRPVADPRPILDDLQHKMASVRSVYWEFDQERRLKLFAEPLHSQGVMLLEQPDKIRWEITEPYQSIMLSSHQSVAQFERENGEWKKLKLGFPQLLRRVMEQMSMMNEGKLDALTADYTVSVATGAVAVVTLVPKNEDVRSLLASIQVQMQPDFTGTHEVVMNEPGGDLTRITFRVEKRDVRLPAGTFDQNKPLPLATVEAAVKSEP